VEVDELCDDGNRIDDDGCNNACQVPCGLESATLVLPPTAASSIDGLAIVRDLDENIVVGGFLQEVTVDERGTETVSPIEVLVASFDTTGVQRWSERIVGSEGSIVVADVVTDAEGNVYVAATMDATVGGSDIMVFKLDGSDGSELWSHRHDAPLGATADLAFGVAVGPDGQPVVSGQVRVGEGDDDVWVRKLESSDGTEVWTSTWTGPSTGTFSTDNGGPVAVGPDGEVFVAVEAYLDADTIPTTLLRFAADGGEPVWSFEPDLGLGSEVSRPVDLTVDGEGSVYLSLERPTGGVLQFFVIKVDGEGAEVWSKARTEFETFPSEWVLAGAAPTDSGDLVVGGRVLNDGFMDGSGWWEIWLARLDDEGNPLCSIEHQSPSDALLPPSLFGRNLTVDGAGAPLVVGQLLDDEDEALWLGRFLAE
jgi:cysteine-rich repeat protein